MFWPPRGSNASEKEFMSVKADNAIKKKTGFYMHYYPSKGKLSDR